MSAEATAADRSYTADKFLDRCGVVTGVTDTIAAAQVHATLALAAAVQEQTRMQEAWMREVRDLQFRTKGSES